MIVTLASVSGAPGVTSWSLLLAAAWPANIGADRVVLEADASGGVLGARYGWGVEPGVVDLLTRLRRSGDSRVLALGGSERNLAPGVSAVPAPEDAGRCRSIWQSEAAVAAPRFRDDARVWIVDAGRFRDGDPTGAFMEVSALVSVVSGGRPEDLVRLPPFIHTVRQLCDRVALLVTGPCSYGADELSEFSGADLLWMAKDQDDLIEHAAVALNDTRARRRSVVWSRALEVASELAVELSRLERSESRVGKAASA